MTATPDPRRTAPQARAALVVGIVTLLLAPVVAIALAVGAVATVSHDGGTDLAIALPAFGLLLGLPAVILGILGFRQASNDRGYKGQGSAIAALILGSVAGVLAVGLGYTGFVIGATAMAGPGGRPYRLRGKARVAPVDEGTDWPEARSPSIEHLTDSERASLGAAWQAEAQGEHASIAAFSSLALDLLSAGAPPGLIADAHRAALDEVAHARECFGLASAYLGAGCSAAPWPAAGEPPPRDASPAALLARVAVESLRDGALHEGYAAALAHEAARRTDDGAVRTVLARIAADEARHAALGWDVLAWCLAHGGPAVRTAVARATAELPAACAGDHVVPGDGDARGAASVYAQTLGAVRDRAHACLAAGERGEAVAAAA